MIEINSFLQIRQIDKNQKKKILLSPGIELGSGDP